MNADSPTRANERRQIDERVEGEIPVEYAYRSSIRYMLATWAYLAFICLSNASRTDEKSGHFHIDPHSIFSSLLIFMLIVTIIVTLMRRVNRDDRILNAFIVDRMHTMIFPARLFTYVLSLVLLFTTRAVFNLTMGLVRWRTVISDDSETLDLTYIQKVEKLFVFVVVGMPNVHNAAKMLQIISSFHSCSKWSSGGLFTMCLMMLICFP